MSLYVNISSKWSLKILLWTSTEYLMRKLHTHPILFCLQPILIAEINWFFPLFSPQIRVLKGFSYTCGAFNWNKSVYKGKNLAEKLFFKWFQVKHIAEVWVVEF